jgi:hypothetical protein
MERKKKKKILLVVMVAIEEELHLNITGELNNQKVFVSP